MRAIATRRACLGACGAALSLLLVPDPARAQTAANVLLVVNENVPASATVGDYYAKKRNVPPEHVVHLAAPPTETVEREEYVRTIERPIAEWLSRQSLQDQVLYIVLAKGVPLRIAGTGGREGTRSSVDSELALLYRRLVGIRIPATGRIENPYFLGDRPLAEARPFTRLTSDVYLVTRLDGFTVDDALALIDRGTAPSREGGIVLDQRAASPDDPGDRWLRQAAERIGEVSTAERAVFESTKERVATDRAVLGYYSWGSGDAANRQRRSGLEFVNGALAAMFVGADGRTFLEPPAGWAPTETGQPSGQFAGTATSLAGDLIRDGVTGVAAHVAEPLLDASIRPQVLFPAYLAGFNLAESFYLAMPFLSWQTVVVGDPLCVPFPRAVPSPDDLHRGIDAETALPALFAERRLALLANGGLNLEALKLALRADVEIQRQNQPAAEELLTRAVALEPRLTASLLRLAAWSEARDEYDVAIERYRQILEHDADNVVALNNLAYALAVRKEALEEALALAQKAYRLSGQSPFIADTLGWIHYLRGDPAAARPFIEQALRGSRNVEILIHAATVHAAMNDHAQARQEIEAAMQLDPSIGERTDVKTLRERLESQ